MVVVVGEGGSVHRQALGRKQGSRELWLLRPREEIEGEHVGCCCQALGRKTGYHMSCGRIRATLATL